MEPNIPRDENIAHEADLHPNNLMERYAGIGRDNNISQGPFHDAVIVKFNLDTTDLSRSREICMIAARCNDNVFNQYIISDKDISKRSSEINGLEIMQVGNERRLFHNGNPVNALGPREGLTNFLDFLRNQSGQVLLAAHNCFQFDGTTIINEMRKHDMLDTFKSLVLGFIDTIPIFKLLLPNRNQENKSFSLGNLAEDYLDASSIPERKNATVNVEILALLIPKFGCTDAIMKQHAKSLDVFIQGMPENVKSRIDGLAPLSNTISKSMIETIAKAGITMDLLNDTYRADGGDGVTMLLQEDVGGKPQVTKNRKIIGSIIAKLLELSLIGHENDIAD